MLPLLVAAAALAGPRPPDVDIEDLVGWEAAAEAILAGPRGCWEFTGEVTLNGTTQSAQSWFGSTKPERHRFTGPFEARLRDGRWERFEYRVQPDDPDDPEISMPIFPLIGEIDPEIVNREQKAERGEEDEEFSGISIDSDGSIDWSADHVDPLNLLSQALDQWSGTAATTVAQWSESRDGVELYRDVPISDKPRAPTAELAVFFPDGGTHASELAARWPRTMKAGTFPFRATLKDTQMHVRTHPHDGQALPLLETASVVVTMMGFTLGYEQALAFRTATPCGS